MFVVRKGVWWNDVIIDLLEEINCIECYVKILII